METAASESSAGQRTLEAAEAEIDRFIERRALDKALQLIQEPRRKRVYAETLAGWVRYPSPTFGEPSDVSALSAIQNLQSGAYSAEQKMQERAYNEQLQAQQEEGVA